MSKKPIKLEKMHTLDEAAKILGYTRGTLRVMAWRGQIGSWKPTERRVFIPQSAIDEFVRSKYRPAGRLKRAG